MKRETEVRLSFDAEGIRVSRVGANGPEVRARWKDIAAATAFKLDLFSYYQIRIRFDLEDGSHVEVNEDAEGWRELIEVLPRFRSSCLSPNEWWAKTTFPPFASCETPLFARDKGEAAKGGVA